MNMNKCLNCGKDVQNKYCNVSCQNSHRATLIREEYWKNPKLCKCCNNPLSFEQKRNDFCSRSCSASFNNKNTVHNINGINGTKPKEDIVKPIKDLIKDKNKKLMFELSKSWQSARSTIRKDACKVFNSSNKERKCMVCGYTNHIEIAHIKAVSEFGDDSTLKEINNIDNLIGLCPNHHWEYDNGLL